MSMKYDPNLYEADQRPFLKEEIRFYKKLCNEFNSETILELGVGTGRIFSELLPVVKYAVGLDISKPMLDFCRKKCAPNKNYNLYKKSFVKFNLNDNFDLIYIPFNTFQHLLSVEEEVSCLECVRRHMNKNSYFILDLMNPENISLDFNNWKLDYSSKLVDGRIIEREQKTIAVNKKESIVHKIFRYKEIMNGQVLQIHEFKALMKINSNKKILQLLKSVGFKIKDIWTDYSFGSDNKSKKIIYCLKIQ